MGKRRIGIVGYGNLGQYLVQQIQSRGDLELAFVWNRTSSALEGKVEKPCILEDLNNFAEREADLIVEVAHPCITRDYGERFLAHADFMIGSPTAMADASTERKLRAAASQNGLYVPSGALWGGEDIRRMADRGTLQALKVTMKKPPESFKLNEPLKSKNDAVKSDAVILYDGPVRELCPLAPNNVNTMAAAAVAAHNLGFDKVQGSIVSDPSLTDWHVVQVDAWGPGNIEDDTAFHCQTIRRNPAKIGFVTGSATYASFLSSMIGARGKGPGVHLC
ncbi:aspartate dehydrogenase domain-containing protein-like [Mercenaria mercenaria]|uniref:aspartate dehydrogenase domain-containing protein-like n=1 Tax=Mercenaria mercenaria TaxID=6596 RepID=UPI00234EB93D|nr:aspartate dehydrogenase domain-containing protein-like [Mercenaria mercenaria]